MATLTSIQTGLPRDYEPVSGDTSDKPWTTSFFKQPVSGPVRVGRLGLEGDAVADTRVHGGADKAVCVYSADRWPYWRERLAPLLENIEEFGPAAFGENFSVAGIDEETVCIGDRWRIGDAEFEVSQPRQPCWKLARRWRITKLTLWTQETGFTGWYVRVTKEGTVTAGDEIELLERLIPRWTIDRANSVMYELPDDRDVNAELAAIGPLSQSWKRQLLKRMS
jgi:MOSC domain-containing protein YiiM